MSARVVSKKSFPDSAAIKQISEPKKDIKQCVKLLASGELRLVDVEGLMEELVSKPQLGDHIQYELHKYCQNDISKTNADLVIKLAELCYSNISVLQFNNIDRFLGCVYYITSYLLKKEKFKPALSIISTLSIKKNEILECSKQKSDIRVFLRNLHSSFIAAAIVLTGRVKSISDEVYQMSHKLAIESLKVFKLTNTEQPEVGKKVLKTSTIYLQSLINFKEEDILEFYKILNEVLTILVTNIGNFDFILYYLHKMSQFKKEGLNMYETLKKSIDFITTVLKSPKNIRQTFYKMLDFFWKYSQENFWCSNSEIQVLKKNELHYELYFILVSYIFSYGMQFLWTKFEKNWCESVSVGLVQKLSKTILDSHRMNYLSSTLYCTTSIGILENCFGDLIVGNLNKIQYTVRLCFKNKVPNALNLVCISRQAFRLSIECLNYRKSINCCKENRIHSWKFTVIHHTNTVEDLCRLNPSNESWYFLKECSHEVLVEVVNSVSLPFDFTRVKILFQRWHFANLKLKNYQDSLFTCLVYYYFYPKEEEDIMSMWLQTKSEAANEIFEEIIMSDIIKTCEKSLREFCESYISSDICLKSALLMELKAYGTCLPDTFQNPNMSYTLATRIWKHLEKYKLDQWETSVALSSLISANIAGDNEKLSSDFHDKCRKLIDELINWERKGRLQCRSLLHAANLTFSLFLYNVKMAEKSEGKMDTSHMILGYLKKAEQEKVKFGEDVDLNLTCDIIPSSTHLTVDLETKYLNELNKVVDLWSNALKNGLEEMPSSQEFDLWTRNVKQVAYLYELIGEYQRAFTTWLMFYKIAKLCDNSAASLLGLTHLIENSADVDESKLRKEAELISEKLGSDSTEKCVLVNYWLTVASNYLKNKKSSKCLEYLSMAKKALEGLRNTIKTYTLNAKFWCLVSQFLAVYKEYEAVFLYPSGTDVRVMAFKAFSYANGGGRSDLIKSATQTECIELVLAMLDVNLWAYHLHGVYRETDFMRFFLDDLYQIVQRLFLPTRTAEMLVRLAEVDMICEKASDCQEKVNKLNSILTLSANSREVIKAEKSPYLSVPQKIDFDTPRPVSPARFLDKRSHSKETDVSPVHYYLPDTKSFKVKEHAKKCKCRLCSNLLIQSLMMSSISLEGGIFNLKNNSKHAAKCYSQAYEILEKLEFARAEQNKILGSELESALNVAPEKLNFKLPFVQFYCARFLIKYAQFESSSLMSVTENVTKIIQRVNELMKTFTYEEKLLQWTFTELKLFCVVLNKGVEQKPKEISPVPYKTPNIVKTPCAGNDVGKTPKIKNSSVKPEVEKTSVTDDKSSSGDAMNCAFIVSDKSQNQRIFRPRKLSFCTNEPETNTKTVKKIPKEKPSTFQSRKLDFNISRDLFDEQGDQDAKNKAPAQTRALRQTRNTATSKTKSESSKSVKIYVDSKTDVKEKKTEIPKMKSKTRKT